MSLWFKSHLSNHSQFVEMTQMECRNFTQYRYTASLRTKVQGVPQGSILQPLCFITNKLPPIEQIISFICSRHTNILVVKKKFYMLSKN